MLVKGDYEIIPVKNQVMDYIVKDSIGHILANKQDTTKGKFAFSTENNDMFEICFISHIPAYQKAVCRRFH